ncbi:MAG: energy-coupling factor transporter transmembrane protein EcfT [Candidatus Eisenbacteria sp.]|nr:energy-coupling factor transporter transmembrane protein EcfT [Candidatus Eisenbacteria bacterium]
MARRCAFVVSMALGFRLGPCVEADSLLHAIDPRAKILVGALFLVWIFLFPGWGSFALLAVLLAACTWVSGVPPGRVTGNLRALSALWLVCFLVNLVFAGGGEPIWCSPSREALLRGVESGLFFCVRLGLIVSVGSLVSLTTCPTALGDAVDQGLRRVPGIGQASGRLALILVLAWTFVPVLLDEARRLAQAQRARGGGWRTGWIGCVLDWRSVFVPLLIGTLRCSEALALAMEARGFGGAGRRSYYRELRIVRRDIAVVLVCVAAAVGGGFLWKWERGL